MNIWIENPDKGLVGRSKTGVDSTGEARVGWVNEQLINGGMVPQSRCKFAVVAIEADDNLTGTVRMFREEPEQQLEFLTEGMNNDTGRDLGSPSGVLIHVVLSSVQGM